MELTNREFWTLIHGMILGALFLLAFAGGLAGFYSLRPQWLTVMGIRERIVRLAVGTTVMAVVAWLTVLTGTWIVCPCTVPNRRRERLIWSGTPARFSWPTKISKSGTSSGWSGKSTLPGLRQCSQRSWRSELFTTGGGWPTSRASASS